MGAAPTESPFSLSTMHEVRLKIGLDAMAKLARQPTDFVPARFSFDGEREHKVRVRFKGNRSLRTWAGKPSFKVDFGDGPRFRGESRLTLNNLVEDPTFLGETLAYHIFRALDVPAPRTGYAQVLVNDEPFGVYLLVEQLGVEFLARWAQDSSGPLYEGEFGCDVYPDDVWSMELDRGSDPDRAALGAFAAAASGTSGTFFERLGPLLYRDRFLAYLAVSTFIEDFDGYRHGHNYYLYRDPGPGRWFMIPWGLDRTFDHKVSLYDSDGYLARLCFADAECRRAYVAMLHRVADTVEEMDLGVFDALAMLTNAAVRADPKRDADEPQVRRERLALRRFLGTRPGEIRTQAACLDGETEIDADKDGFGCMDCDDEDPAIHPGAKDVCDGRDNDCSGLGDDDPACPCDVLTASGGTFHLCNLPMTWESAQRFCGAQGLRLARIDNAEQSKALSQAARSRRDDDEWWFGINDRADEGEFVWDDRATVTYTNWSKQEPDDYVCGQDCGGLRTSGDGEWRDIHCAVRSSFICR